MPATKKAAAPTTDAAAPKERKKPGPKPGSKRTVKPKSTKVFKIFASDGDALAYITSVTGVNTGPQAVLKAVRDGAVAANTPVVPISERFLTPIEIETEERQPVFKVKTAARAKRKYTRRTPVETNGDGAAAPAAEPVVAAAAPAGSPAAAGNPFAQ